MARPAAPRWRGAESFGALAAPEPAIQLSSVTFLSDHGLLKGCEFPTDWRNDGAPCPVPQWTPRAQGALSHTMGEPIRLVVEALGAYGGPGAGPALRGRGPGGMTFSPAPAAPPRGPASIEMRSNVGFPRKIQKVAFDIRWSSEGGAPTFPSQTPTLVFVTMGRPMDDRKDEWQEDGVTLRRMDTAVSWVAPLDTVDPQEIVAGLMEKFDFYSLRPSPKVPAHYQHPRYFNKVGGAWPLAEYAEESAECQAIVRFVRAVLRQLGIPGKSSVIVVWADPAVGGGRQALTADQEAHPDAGLDAEAIVNGRRVVAALVDAPVQEGRTYPPSHTRLPDGSVSPGLNRYEACLVFTHGGVTRYYAAGAGEYPSKDAVLQAFWGLVWVSEAAGDGFRVERIVARYRDDEDTP